MPGFPVRCSERDLHLRGAGTLTDRALSEPPVRGLLLVRHGIFSQYSTIIISGIWLSVKRFYNFRHFAQPKQAPERLTKAPDL